MISQINYKTLFTVILSLVISLSITIIIYWQGLNSPFLLDDVPNLNTMGKYQYLGVWHDLALFLLNGDSGPTGRPISLLSFYLNDNSWSGAVSFDFKYTNLMIHLVNGLLVYWLTYKISESLNLTKYHITWLPLLTAFLWLVAPIHNTTVLYVVQRMTELSTLFSLTSLIIYFFIRHYIINKKYKKALSLIFFFSINYFLSILSKENGLLTGLYILTLEYFLFSNNRTKELKYFLYIFSWLPFLIVFFLLIKTGWFDSHNRFFTTEERLLTQTRIIWDYLYQIILPKANFMTLMHDDYTISKSFFSPWHTIVAFTGIIALIYYCWVFRKKHKLFSFGIFWFFTGHLLESTSIPLELYFEHRNYLPSYGIFIVLSFCILKFILSNHKFKKAILACTIIYIFSLSLINLDLSRRWTKPLEMTNIWLENHPNSQRTIEMLDVIIGTKIDGITRKKILSELDRAANINNTSSYLVFRNLDIQCQNNIINEQDLEKAIDNLKNKIFVAATPTNFANFIQRWLNTGCGNLSSKDMTNFIEKLKSISTLQVSIFPHILAYWQAQVYIKQGDLDGTIKFLDLAYSLNKSIDITLEQASYLSSAGLYKEAGIKLTRLEPDFCNQWRSCMILKLRQPDINNLKAAILKAQQKANNDEQAVHHSTGEKRS